MKEFIAHFRAKDSQAQYLWDHLFGTSLLAGKFASKIGLKEHGELLGLVHDLGKASVEFYQYIKSATGTLDTDADEYINAEDKKGKIDHSTAGAQLLYRNLSVKGLEGFRTAQILSLIVASHHSGLIDCITTDGLDNFDRRMNKPGELTKIREAESNLDDCIKQRIKNILENDALCRKMNEKIKLLKEKNDSLETILFKIGLLTKFLFSCLIDADRLNTADFEFPDNMIIRNHGVYVDWLILSERLEKHIKQFKINNQVDILRREVSEKCMAFSNKPQGLYQLTVPTGGGKTLSSLRFAINHAQKHGMDRIIYIIPYTSIIDQNADTVRKILEVEKDEFNRIVLEHHSNLTPEKEGTRNKILSENWDAPIVFTTMVQFLETLFGSGTRDIRRMHQLANSVLIFDEIQTLPIRCVHLFNVAIRFLVKFCHSTVVLCTATQPLLSSVTPKERALETTQDHQIVENIQTLFKELKRVEVIDKCNVEGWSESEIVELIKEELHDTGSVLVITNTKKSAFALYESLCGRVDASIYHLSTNMCPAHRMDVLNQVKKCLVDDVPIVCVSTQLIEAGIDIDFGSVIRYLAGLDSISQAAGRCNRNGKRAIKGRVTVINPKNENLDKLKDILIGRDIAERILLDYKKHPAQYDYDLLGLKAIEKYYEYYFFRRSNEMDYKISQNSKIGRTDSLFELLSKNRLSVESYKRQNRGETPKLLLYQSFKAAADEFKALDSPTCGIIVPYGEKGKHLISQLCSSYVFERQYNLLKQAQKYSVNVFSNTFASLMKQKAIYEINNTGVYYLDKQYYSDGFGLSEYPINVMDYLIISEV